MGSTKQLGGKYFILQSNEAFSKEPLLMEINPNSKSSEQNLYNTKSQSFIESTNKQFFDKYVEQLLKSDCSLSFFAFSAFFKVCPRRCRISGSSTTPSSSPAPR